jgi:hypothetical protein
VRVLGLAGCLPLRTLQLPRCPPGIGLPTLAPAAGIALAMSAGGAHSTGGTGIHAAPPISTGAGAGVSRMTERIRSSGVLASQRSRSTSKKSIIVQRAWRRSRSTRRRAALRTLMLVRFVVFVCVTEGTLPTSAYLAS